MPDPNEDPDSDEALMRRVARHDRDADFVLLVQRYQILLVNHFARHGVRGECEDLAQETFLRLYRARKRYRTTARFRTFLYRIAHHVWIDHLRRSSRRQRREDAFREEPRPESQDHAGMVGHDIAWALAKLSEAQRDVVVLSVFDQLSHADIASVLDIPEGTVKSRLHHAMRELRNHFAQAEGKTP